ncbi:M23 family metallopeptidase [Microbacterium sp. B35-30]|uniref:murein hydrolase activator EnvC family protein n=1 Tax=Microbacterium sp. B35-30 TaxID=1962642 RepID=UPI0013CF4FF7|nr:M23 family metallopeptidase [Microbacterium sp. B35-30]KAF2419339.1 peptidase M23 [Microbacterium sp. B35-30]
MTRSAGIIGRGARAVASCALALCLAAAWSPETARADGRADEAMAAAGGGPVSRAERWLWPVQPFRLERPFVAPPHEYGPGHRGIDLTVLGENIVRAPAEGVVAFSGQVAGRGILTIDHGGGLVSTLEPVDSALLAGTPIAAGAEAGTVSTGGHTALGALHFGVRLDGSYINPLVLLGGVPRAVLLTCC